MDRPFSPPSVDHGENASEQATRLAVDEDSTHSLIADTAEWTDTASVASASTLGTMFLDTESQEDQIIKAELKELEKDFEEQSNRLMGAETTVREFRDQLLHVQSERDSLKELQTETQREMQLLQRQAETVVGLDASLKSAIGEIDRLKKIQLKEGDAERDQEMDVSRLKVQALNLEVARLHDEIAEERLEKERIRQAMESELVQMMEDLSQKTREEFEQRLTDAIEEVDRLKKLLNYENPSNGEGSVPTEKEQNLQNGLDQLQQQFAQARNCSMEKEQKSQIEIVQLQFELAEVRDSLQATRNENERIRKESQVERERLEIELFTSHDECDRLRSSMSKKGQVPRDDVSKAVAHAVEPRDEHIKELRKQVTQLNQTTKRGTEDQSWLKARLKVYQEESSLLQRQLIEQRKGVDHEVQLAHTGSRNAKAETERLHRRLETTCCENQKVIAELETLKDTLGKLRRQSARQNARSSASESLLQDKVSELESVLGTKDGEIGTLREQLGGLLAESTQNVQNSAPTTQRSNVRVILPVESTTNAITETLTRADSQHFLDVFEDAVAGSPEQVLSEVTKRHEMELIPTIEIPRLKHEELLPQPTDFTEVPQMDEEIPPQQTTSIETPQEDEIVETNQDSHDAFSALTGGPGNDSTFDSESVDTPVARGSGDIHDLESFEEHVHIWPRSWHDNDGRSKYEGRDVVGYGINVPKPMWPNMAKVALNFVIHYEEGSEMCLLHGDNESESRLTEIVGAQPLKTQRNVNIESLYDYGSRAGFWRLHRLFTAKKAKCTVFATGMALERNPQAGIAMKEAGWEVASHGYRLMNYQDSDEKTEQEHMERTIAIHKKILGDAPAGIFLGRPSTNSRRLAAQKFYYDSDSYSDELPFWTLENGSPHLVIPCTLSQNDMKFVTPSGFANGAEFHEYLVKTLDALIAEGRAGRPKMMTVALHCRISGRPGRAAGISQFMDYAQGLGSDIWICTKEDVARYWYDAYYPKGGGTPVGKTVVR